MKTCNQTTLNLFRFQFSPDPQQACDNASPSPASCQSPSYQGDSSLTSFPKPNPTHPHYKPQTCLVSHWPCTQHNTSSSKINILIFTSFVRRVHLESVFSLFSPLSSVNVHAWINLEWILNKTLYFLGSTQSLFLPSPEKMPYLFFRQRREANLLLYSDKNHKRK